MPRTFPMLLCVMLLACGCARSDKPSSSRVAGQRAAAAKPTTQPILYHRTGGIAGTDDRVVIWPDGVVDVRGKLLPESTSHLSSDRLARLVTMLDGWRSLAPTYLGTDIPDGYTITISYGGKSIQASDLAPNLPEQFRRIFTEIESIAAQASTTDIKIAP